MELPQLEPYPLPQPATESVLDLARESNVLLFGEFHGTQEVPRLLLKLLDPLAESGYQGLAFEIPADQREALVHWAEEKVSEPPRLFTHPYGDGRENLQTLALARKAVQKQWQILCFDVGAGQPNRSWVERDGTMARNFTEQWDQFCPGRKVVGVCGNMHSRLEQMSGEAAQYWPSFASGVRSLNSSIVVSSIVIWVHQGTFFNQGQVQAFMDRGPLSEPEVRDGKPSQHSLALHLPKGTVATFLASPSR